MVWLRESFEHELLNLILPMNMILGVKVQDATHRCTLDLFKTGVLWLSCQAKDIYNRRFDKLDRSVELCSFF